MSKIWYPFTQHKNMIEPMTIIRGNGTYLYDQNNKQYLDLISSWWTNIHGHCHLRIAQAIARQAKRLDHVIFSNFNHQPALDFAERLTSCLAQNLQHVFFSDNGSTAVEVALKISYQYWRNILQDCSTTMNQKIKKNTLRSEFVSFTGNYHGDTIGAMSVGKKSHYFNLFSDLLIPVNFLPFPQIMDNKNLQYKQEELALQKATELFKKKKDRIASVIIEPLVQGSNGMTMCSIEFLNKFMKICKKNEILIIFDEVMTGFGRTGKLFAYQHLNIVPDIICLAKGITGGFLPLSVTVASTKIFSSFLGNDFSSALSHGHSYTANPIACAAANESLKILLQNHTQKKIQRLVNWQKQMLNKLKKKINNEYKIGNSQNFIVNIRSIGTISAFELSIKNNKNNNEYQGKMSNRLKHVFLEKGLIIRPLGNTIYLMPPYCIRKDVLAKSYDMIANIIINFS